MISTRKAVALVCEPDAEKRDKMIEKLSEEDAKCLLKMCFTAARKLSSDFTSTSKIHNETTY